MHQVENKVFDITDAWCNHEVRYPLCFRYLDIRLGTKTGSRDLYFVHGLYGMEVEKILQEVDAF